MENQQLEPDTSAVPKATGQRQYLSLRYMCTGVVHVYLKHSRILTRVSMCVVLNHRAERVSWCESQSRKSVLV